MKRKFVELQKRADARVTSATMRGVQLARQIQKKLDEDLLDSHPKGC